MAKVLSFIFITILGSLALARVSDGKATFKVQAGKIVGSIEKGFHFNKDAPASFSIKSAEIAPLTKTEKELAFALPAKENEPFELSFYVCDDKKTVCEEHKLSYVLAKGQLKSAAPTDVPPASKETTPVAKSAKIEKNHHGFILNNLEAAKALATKTKKNIFVDYGAPWCPACVRLETEVFGTKEFKVATKNLILVALNADMSSNKWFGKQFDIKAIPTALILSPEGKELYRLVDFALAKEYSNRIADVQKNIASFATLEQQALSGNKKALKLLADKAYDSMDWEAATKWYGLLEPKTDRYAYSEINLWSKKNDEDKKNETAYLAVLKKWALAQPHTYTAVSAAIDWADYLKNEKKEQPAELKAVLISNADFLKKLTASKDETKKWFANVDTGTMDAFETIEALAQWKSTAEALGRKDEAKGIENSMQKELAAIPFSETRPGQVMMAQSYFRKANMKNEEETWLQKLAKADEKNYVFHMKLANFYKRNKEYDKALPEAKLAVELGEDMRLYNLQTLAEIQKELKQKEDAKKTLEMALTHPDIKTDRFKDLLKELEEMKKNL